jgi:2-(1,2-epoxy-1,2-dihydrophenyl)acetyl-CoA isomerase
MSPVSAPPDDIAVAIGDDGVAVVELRRPPANFVDVELLARLADVYEVLDQEHECRVILLCSEGKHFCAGAQIDPDSDEPLPRLGAAGLYEAAVRLFSAQTPVVVAIQGAAIGAGLGLACSADFRVAAPEARFAANFARLGFHHGFGLTVTLPLIVGHQNALNLLFTGRRVAGTEAVAIGLCDVLAPSEQLRQEAHDLASQIAQAAPLAVRAIRETMRNGLADQFRAATVREGEEQTRLRETADFAEGIRATAERREPRFVGA